MCVNNLRKVATQWNSGATRDSNRGRRVLIPSALTTTPPSHTVAHLLTYLLTDVCVCMLVTRFQCCRWVRWLSCGTACKRLWLLWSMTAALRPSPTSSRPSVLCWRALSTPPTVMSPTSVFHWKTMYVIVPVFSDFNYTKKLCKIIFAITSSNFHQLW